jgi:hypothetical protein
MIKQKAKPENRKNYKAKPVKETDRVTSNKGKQLESIKIKEFLVSRRETGGIACSSPFYGHCWIIFSHSIPVSRNREKPNTVHSQASSILFFV